MLVWFAASLVGTLFLLFASSEALCERAILVRVTDLTEWAYPSSDPAGIAFIEELGGVLICDSEIDETSSSFEGFNLFESTLEGELKNAYSSLKFSHEPTGVSYDPSGKRYFISDDDVGRVFVVKVGEDGLLNTEDDVVTYLDTRGFGSRDPEDVLYDSVSGVLYVVDGETSTVFKIRPGVNRIFDGVPPMGDDLITWIRTKELGLTDPEGIALDRSSGLLYIVGKPNNAIFVVSTSGELMEVVDISSAHPVKPAGITVGPSTVKKGAWDVFIVDRGVDNNSSGDVKAAVDGRLYEFHIPSMK